MTKADEDSFSYLQAQIIEQLREAMELRGVKTYAELARLSDMSATTTQFAMAGSRCSMKAYERIARGLGVRISATATTIPGWVPKTTPEVKRLHEDTVCEGAA